jgi:hypothetical protein
MVRGFVATGLSLRPSGRGPEDFVLFDLSKAIEGVSAAIDKNST